MISVGVEIIPSDNANKLVLLIILISHSCIFIDKQAILQFLCMEKSKSEHYFFYNAKLQSFNNEEPYFPLVLQEFSYDATGCGLGSENL